MSENVHFLDKKNDIYNEKSKGGWAYMDEKWIVKLANDIVPNPFKPVQ